MDCHELDDLTHAVLAVVSSAYNPKSRVSKYTTTQIQNELGLKWKEVQEFLQELQELKFIEQDKSIKVLKVCYCKPDKIFPNARSRAGNGSWRSVEAPLPNRVVGGVATEATTSDSKVKYPQKSENSKHTTAWQKSFAHAESEANTLRGRKISKNLRLDQPVSEWHGRDLAFYFAREKDRVASKVNVLPSVNIGMLSKNFADMLNEGVDSETIKAMIDEFCSDPKWVKEEIGLSRSFLRYKERLYKEVARKQKRAKRQEYGDDWGYGKS